MIKQLSLHKCWHCRLFAGRQSKDLLPTFARNSDIPVYTNIKVNNITIRANDKCPLFLKRLINLYSSGPFLTMEHEVSSKKWTGARGEGEKQA